MGDVQRGRRKEFVPLKVICSGSYFAAYCPIPACLEFSNDGFLVKQSEVMSHAGGMGGRATVCQMQATIKCPSVSEGTVSILARGTSED